ncbi:MAG: hypothetical protein RMY16_12630 [Nostoc sp. DedQUE12b]|uniref:hypothetical protein n=1 Tax=Nostoc sp. DedQUE12b TaxID=3075398 RepID=UPI002AD3C768|nr:hypothetical protein [Nostoc sp. DedQUE12b]MDZ8086390.1 hypothetical protein [Nostoc sp. DedQUE12b]
MDRKAIAVFLRQAIAFDLHEQRCACTTLNLELAKPHKVIPRQSVSDGVKTADSTKL